MSSDDATPGACPWGGRFAAPPEAPVGARVERVGGVWRIGSLAAARAVLRARGATTQAGFTAEFIPTGALAHRPILLSDGPEHDEQRRAVGRFFAPRALAAHVAHMEACAGRLLDEAAGAGRRRDAAGAAAGITAVATRIGTALRRRTHRRGPATGDREEAGLDAVDLDELALWYAVEVTARIVGLTSSPVRAMSRRLEAFFRQPPLDMSRADLGRTRRQWILAAVRGVGPLARFWFADVRPAVRARRRAAPFDRPDDVLTHLVAQGYSDTDILVEAVTYGTAGMVTTREFMTMAAWHLLTDAALRASYLAGDEAARHDLLEEILRVEPVVGHLYRRVREPIEVSDGEAVHRLAPGELVDVCVRDANADPAAFAPSPGVLVPGRAAPRGVAPSGLTFGDGTHTCPGRPLAILEADVLLRRLLARRPRLVAAPTVAWDDLLAGYRLRGMRVALGGEAGAE